MSMHFQSRIVTDGILSELQFFVISSLISFLHGQTSTHNYSSRGTIALKQAKVVTATITVQTSIL